ncbi:MAG: hypothetical protein JSV25_12795 [Spirochaetota bacterium]|nr:MAG: hypothetical protein JSV25_12795 [Spirochaetota bacterium]
MSSKEEIRSSWLELFCFMSSSARGLVGEPALYGPFRLVDSLEKIIVILENLGMADEFMEKEKAKIAEKKLIAITDRDAFIDFLDEIVIDFTKELKKAQL